MQSRSDQYSDGPGNERLIIQNVWKDHLILSGSKAEYRYIREQLSKVKEGSRRKTEKASES